VSSLGEDAAGGGELREREVLPVVSAASIRLADDRDAEAVQRIYAPFVLHTAVSFETVPPGIAEMRARIAKTLPRYPWLVLEEGSEVIGYVYASAHRERPAYVWSVDTTVYVDAAHRRRGAGRALYASLFAVLELQGFHNAFAGIALPNPGSVGLHEALGFQAIGVYREVGYKLGRWHDVGWWQRPLRAPDAAPEPPKLVSEVAEGEGWEAALGAGLGWLRG
jgi:L-amino acid N-acyltransferase YncA